MTIDSLKARKFQVFKSCVNTCFRTIAILFLLGLLARGILFIIDPPSTPTQKDLILGKRLEEEIKRGEVMLPRNFTGDSNRTITP